MTYGEWYIQQRELMFNDPKKGFEIDATNAPKKMNRVKLVDYYNSKLKQYWQQKGMV
jgi:hypothetical protein